MRYNVIRLAKGGFGISNETGKTFFVENGLPGESGNAEIIEEKDRFGRCRPISRDLDSPHRCLHDTCPCSRECDGCGFRHVKPESALELKAAATHAEILKAAHLPDMPYELAALHDNALDGTRRRVRIHADHGKLGFYARSSHHIISAAQCVIIAPQLQSAIQWLEQNFIIPDDVRLDIQIDLNAQNEIFAHFKTVEERILKKHQHRPGMKRNPAPQKFDINKLAPFAAKAVKSGPFKGVRIDSQNFGQPWICDEISVNDVTTKTWRRIGDFAQATSEANAHIHRIVAEFLRRTKPAFAADLYSGSGNLTFRAATLVPHVEGYEFFCDEDAFNRGKNDNIPVFAPNASVKLNKCDLSKGLPASATNADVIICDPARDGLSDKIAQDICASSAREILYVSCEASCLARDIARLATDFSPKRFIYIDMFPQTPHVETVLLLQRNSVSEN